MSIAQADRFTTLSHNPNKRYYDTPGVPASYQRMTDLLKAEEFILSHLYSEIKDKAILDIGVGPGRTTPYLRAISRNYTGTDYSENMLAPCREKYDDANLVLCDARKMDGFAHESFDAVFFFWNAIDDADPGDRILILNEVHRVLKRNGVFVFSAHNLGASVIPAFDFPGVALSWNPIRLIKENALRLRVYSSGLFKRMLTRREMHRSYAVIREYESTAGCIVPTYYITRRAQIRQLEDSGFHQVEAVDKDGSFISRDSQIDEYWYIYYIARKKQAASSEIKPMA